MADDPEYAGYDVGCKLVKYFPGHGWFEGTIEKIRPDAAHNPGGHVRMLEQTAAQAHHWRHNAQPC